MCVILSSSASLTTIQGLLPADDDAMLSLEPECLNDDTVRLLGDGWDEERVRDVSVTPVEITNKMKRKSLGRHLAMLLLVFTLDAFSRVFQ